MKTHRAFFRVSWIAVLALGLPGSAGAWQRPAADEVLPQFCRFLPDSVGGGVCCKAGIAPTTWCAAENLVKDPHPNECIYQFYTRRGVVGWDRGSKFTCRSAIVTPGRPPVSGGVTPWPAAIPERLSSVYLNGPLGDGSPPSTMLERVLERYTPSNGFLWYIGLESTTDRLDWAGGSVLQMARERGLVFQLAMQMRAVLSDFLVNPDPADTGPTPLRANAASWARFLKESGATVHYRPFSEMNYGAEGYSLGYQCRNPGPNEACPNSPKQFARAWIELRKTFRAVGAENVKFLFDVAVGNEVAVSGGRIARQEKVLETLREIRRLEGIEKARDTGFTALDMVGVHPYARILENGKMATFEALTLGGMNVFKQAGFGNVPFVVGEMGVAATHEEAPVSEAVRVRWVHDAFAFARKANISLMTYFSQFTSMWEILPGSRLEKVLKCEIQDFNRTAPGASFVENDCMNPAAPPVVAPVPARSPAPVPAPVATATPDPAATLEPAAEPTAAPAPAEEPASAAETVAQ